MLEVEEAETGKSFCNSLFLVVGVVVVVVVVVVGFSLCIDPGSAYSSPRGILDRGRELINHCKQCEG